jgi:hypothetical protein
MSLLILLSTSDVDPDGDGRLLPLFDSGPGSTIDRPHGIQSQLLSSALSVPAPTGARPPTMPPSLAQQPAFINLELVTWLCRRPSPARKCVGAWRWRAGESEFGQRRIRPLRPPLPRPSGPRVLSNFRRRACRCQRFSTPTEPHHLSRPVERPGSVSGLYQLRFRREQDSQSFRGRNLHPALHLKRHGNRDRANIGSAHRGRLANGQLRLGRPTRRASQQASCTVGRRTDEGRGTAARQVSPVPFTQLPFLQRPQGGTTSVLFFFFLFRLLSGIVLSPY